MHTFVVCAYGESPYLGECVDSLLEQTIKSRILITTSTDNDYIHWVADVNGIEVRVSGRAPDIAGDWNFAYTQAETPYVTIAHQDDLYEPAYAETAVSMMEKRKKPLLFFSDYYERRGDEITDSNVNLRIKKLMLLPMAVRALSGNRAVKRAVLSPSLPWQPPTRFASAGSAAIFAAGRMTTASSGSSQSCCASSKRRRS